MDNNNTNNNTATGTAAEGTEKETQTGTATGTENNAAEGTVTMSKADYDKAIQAAEDRVRTKYSKTEDGGRTRYRAAHCGTGAQGAGGRCKGQDA